MLTIRIYVRISLARVINIDKNITTQKKNVSIRVRVACCPLNPVKMIKGRTLSKEMN